MVTEVIKLDTKTVVKCEATRVQWSANDMLPIISNQSGCGGVKKRGVER